MRNATQYDQDFHAWAHEQAALLRAGRLSEADVEHVADEIESMGKSEQRELVSRLTVLLLHVLKWRYQPSLRCKSWELSIRIQRDAITDHVQDNPSLKAHIPTAAERAYRAARLQAAGETGLAEDMFPAACPWSFEMMMTEVLRPAEADTNRDMIG